VKACWQECKTKRFYRRAQLPVLHKTLDFIVVSIGLKSVVYEVASSGDSPKAAAITLGLFSRLRRENFA
jgi:hypothetical protein